MCDDSAHFHKAIDGILSKLKLPEDVEGGKNTWKSRDIVDIIDGYKGRGYALSTDEELGMIRHSYIP